MKSPRPSVAQAYAALNRDLGLTWLNTDVDGRCPLKPDPEGGPKTRLIGPLNYNSAHRVQLIGPAEARLFNDTSSLDSARFDFSLTDTVDVLVVTDGLQPSDALLSWATAHQVPFLAARHAYGDLQQNLRHLITRRLAERRIIHGVMMDVHGTGVLITGEASAGKSEVALELISRGHILVADDAPEFTRIAPGILECSCPPLLQDFLEVRGLGVLNIARMYGETQTRMRKVLRFIVHLKPIGRHKPSTASPSAADDMLGGDRMREPGRTRTILDVAIPERLIPVGPGRNLAVLVEAAVRDHNLRVRGYSATRDLIDRQATAIQSGDPSGGQTESQRSGHAGGQAEVAS